MTTVDLRADAMAEADRLRVARAFLRADDAQAVNQLESEATWIMVSRRTSLKKSLGQRVCLIWRVAFEEASGRVVASTLVPVLVDVPRIADRRTAAWMGAFLQQADRTVRDRVEVECGPWRAEVTRRSETFSSTRLRRALAIARHAHRDNASFQSGLFDRRAERSRDAHASATAEVRLLAATRVRAIRAAARIAARPAQLLLVLVS